MEFRIYDRQTLAYKDGGYVASYNIDDDYIVNNNSTITIVKPLNDKVVEGDTIVLIQTSGVFHKGTINTFDNSDLNITYKADKELLNNNMLNPRREDFIAEVEEGQRVYTTFGLEYVADVIKAYFGRANDQYRYLPIQVYTDGDVLDVSLSTAFGDDSKVTVVAFDNKTFIGKVGEITSAYSFFYSEERGKWRTREYEYLTNEQLLEYGISINGQAGVRDVITVKPTNKMVWTWDNDEINFVDWLIDIFEKYNVVLKWDIDFDIANNYTCKVDNSGKIITRNGEIQKVNERRPFYIITLSALSNSPKIIKDNVNKTMQSITYTEKQQPEATVCTLIDKDTKEIVQLSSGINMLNPNLSVKGKNVTVDSGYEEITDDVTSNYSNLIKVTKGTTYTFSCLYYDGNPRYILAYKDSYTIINAIPYNLGQTTIATRLKTTFTVPQDSEVKYVRICYYANSNEMQLQEGNVAHPIYDAYNQPAIYYLCEKNANYYVSLNQDESEVKTIGMQYYKTPLRVLPSKMKIVTYDESGTVTPQKCAEDTLIPSKFNQAIEVRLNADSKMFDFTSSFGDYYKVINENGIIDTVYTGRKESSDGKWITLYFGLGRQKYTDLIQMRLRKNKYQVLYNKPQTR